MLVNVAVAARLFRFKGSYAPDGGVVVGQVEIAVLAPAGAPAVLDEPCAVSWRGHDKVALAEIVVPANEGDRMVCLGILVLIERCIVGAELIVADRGGGII